jgi:hypothetical protein
LGQDEVMIWWLGRLAIPVGISIAVLGLWHPWAFVAGGFLIASWATGMLLELRQRAP